jgi:ribosome biogenesis GTPase
MAEGIIYKALSGFYYVKSGEGVTECRARGKFRHEGQNPLVGDRVEFDPDGKMVVEIKERKNAFMRPPVANLDIIVIVASRAIPVTDPFLIDKMTTIAEHNGVEPIIVFNKTDLESPSELKAIYDRALFRTCLTSCETGEGIDELKELLRGSVAAFTGNSGVGKSSLLNALDPRFSIETGEVSEKLGRGRHTTRHVELFDTDFGAVIADTPGFSSFETESGELDDPASLEKAFRDFRPYIEKCRFIGCAHTRESGCAVIDAVRAGKIEKSRHESYVRLYEKLSKVPEWQRNKKKK